VVVADVGVLLLQAATATDASNSAKAAPRSGPLKTPSP